jgi:serine/threonine protein kinase
VEERTVFQPSAVGSVRPGVRLNGVYEIEKLVAQGGMGEVYRGFNIHTGDVVAIKMIRPESEFLDNPDVSELFRREASILFNLVHEAIVRYFTFSIDPDIRRAYLAMEFVDGPSLTKRLASGPLPLDEVRILQRRIASALAAAHRLGVIHRDVSSDNIILPDSDVNKAKIIDFGIARSQRRESRTIIGSGIAGKLNYMSPEQLGLAGGDVTFKSDIYSFGLVLAEALRGQPLDMSGSQAEIIEKRRVVPDLSSVDKSIRPLIQAMLQPLPTDRPASMAAVAAWEPGDAIPTAPRAPRALLLPDAVREREPAGGRAAAMLAAVIALASVGGAGYVFRGEIAQWGQSIIAPAPPGPVKSPSVAETQTSALPVLPKEPTVGAPEQTPGAASPAPSLAPAPASPPPSSAGASDATGTGSASDAERASQGATTQPPPGSAGPSDATGTESARNEGRASPDAAGPQTLHSFTPDEIVNQLLAGRAKTIKTPPVNEQAPVQVALPPQSGEAAQTPGVNAVADRTQPPANEATPRNAPQQSEAVIPSVQAAPPTETAQPGQASSRESGPVARLERPVASQPVVVLSATAGAEFAADLPQFSAGTNAAALTLRAEPHEPLGLAFADLGSGSSRLSGTPTTPGPYTFDVVATEPSGLSARMGVKLLVAPEETQPGTLMPEPSAHTAELNPQQPVESLSPIEKARAFVKAFDGGDCFFIKRRVADGPHAYQAVGREQEPFQRFDSGYKSAVGVEADLTLAPITPEQCPALDLVRLGAAGGAAPRIELANYDIGRGKPLAGTISDLGGRRLYLVLVDNNGVARRLDAKTQPGGDAATFSVPITPRADSVGPMQVLLAIVSDAPIPALDNLRSAPLKSAAAHLVDEARRVSASVEADYFKFVN